MLQYLLYPFLSSLAIAWTLPVGVSNRIQVFTVTATQARTHTWCSMRMSIGKRSWQYSQGRQVVSGGKVRNIHAHCKQTGIGFLKFNAVLHTVVGHHTSMAGTGRPPCQPDSHPLWTTSVITGKTGVLVWCHSLICQATITLSFHPAPLNPTWHYWSGWCPPPTPPQLVIPGSTPWILSFWWMWHNQLQEEVNYKHKVRIWVETRVTYITGHFQAVR